MGRKDKQRKRAPSAESPATGNTAPRDWRLIAIVIGLVALTLCTYVPAMRGGFIWDDDAYVTENPTLRTADGLRQIWLKVGATPQYYPLVFTSFWFEYRLWGLNPTGFHVVSVLLHAASAVLLWRLLLRLGAPGALLAAAVFAVHPVHVESVAWITERKNTLSLFFYLLAMRAYLRFAPPDTAAESPRSPDWFAYAQSLVFFGAALLSKTVTASLPAALLLIYWWRRGRLRPAEVGPLLPMFVVGLFMGLMTARLEKHHVGASGLDWELSLVQRCLVAGRAVWFYLAKLIAPYPLVFQYARWEVDAAALWQFAFPVAALATLMALYVMRARIGRGPLTAALLFVGTLVPALGFFDVYPFRYSFVADHFQYHASIGLIALLCGSGSWLAARGGVAPVGRPAAGAAVVLGLAVLAWRQCGDYRDLETLWRNTIAKNSGAFLAHNNLGSVYMRRGDYVGAAQRYEAAVRLRPQWVEPLNNLAAAHIRAGDAPRAERFLREALQRDPRSPDANANLAAVLYEQGKLDEARSCVEAALAARPGFPLAIVRRGSILAAEGRFDEALAAFREAVRLEPRNSEAHFYMGAALMKQRRFNDAAVHLKEAAVLEPTRGDLQSYAGAALLGKEAYDEAIVFFERAVQIKPDELEWRCNLAAAYENVNRPADAIREYEAVLRVNPAYERALHAMKALRPGGG